MVLLPEPLGPSKPTTSPCSIAKETLFTARRGPYHFVTCCASTTVDISLQGPDGAQRFRAANHPNAIPGARPGSWSYPRTRSLVIFGRVLVSFVNVRIVRVNDVASLGVMHSLHPRIGVEHTHRIINASNAWQDVLVEVFLKIDGVTGKHDRAGLRQTYDQDLTARGVRYRPMDINAVVTKQVEVALELDRLVFARHCAAHAVSQHGEIVADEEGRVTRCRPERVPDLVPLIHKGRFQELADIAGVVDMEMTEHNVFDVGRLDVDLAELGVDGDVRRTTGIETFDKRSPVIRIGNDLVVVTTIEQHVSLWMTNQEEADGNLHFAARAVLDDGLVEVQRP